MGDINSFILVTLLVNIITFSGAVNVKFSKLSASNLATDTGFVGDTSDPYPMMISCRSDNDCESKYYTDWELLNNINPDWTKFGIIESGEDNWVYFIFCVRDKDFGLNPDDELGCTQKLQVDDIKKGLIFQNLTLSGGDNFDSGTSKGRFSVTAESLISTQEIVYRVTNQYDLVYGNSYGVFWKPSLNVTTESMITFVYTVGRQLAEAQNSHIITSAPDGVLKEPTTFTEINADENVYWYRPNPPTIDHICFGDIITTNGYPSSLDLNGYKCVYKDWVNQFPVDWPAGTYDTQRWVANDGTEFGHIWQVVVPDIPFKYYEMTDIRSSYTPYYTLKTNQ